MITRHNRPIQHRYFYSIKHTGRTYTKLFLSCVDKFESTIYVKNGYTPIWKARGNFLSLLNLPLQQEYYGNIRNFWEGEHERYIQHVKPLLSQLRHSTSFLVTKLERLYQYAAIDYVLQSIPNRFLSGNLVKTYERNCNYIIYKSLDSVNQLMADRSPISGIQLSSINNSEQNTDQYYVVIKDTNNSLKCVKFQFKESVGRIKCAHYYKFVEFFHHEKNHFKKYDSISILQNDICHFLLMVPDLESNENPEYTIVSNEWTYLNSNMYLDFSMIQNNLFKEI